MESSVYLSVIRATYDTLLKHALNPLKKITFLDELLFLYKTSSISHRLHDLNTN